MAGRRNAGETRRFGSSLLLASAGGAAFFALTDPRWRFMHGSRSVVDYIDAVRNAAPGTWIGLIGSALVGVIGLWLVLRRAT